MSFLPNHNRPWMSRHSAGEAAEQAEALASILRDFESAPVNEYDSESGTAGASGDSSHVIYLQGRATERLASLAKAMGFDIYARPEDATKSVSGVAVAKVNVSSSRVR